jgi:hypothetical protein
LTATSPLGKWAWREAELPNRDVWSYVEIPLDLDGAVTMTATIAATLPQEDGGTVRSIWIGRHERTLVWRIEDSLDGESWFMIADGAATRTEPTQVTRISFPLGTRARLALWANCVIASIRQDDNSTQARQPCLKTQSVAILGGVQESCAFDHSTLVVTNVAFNVAVRSI